GVGLVNQLGEGQRVAEQVLVDIDTGGHSGQMGRAGGEVLSVRLRNHNHASSEILHVNIHVDSAFKSTHEHVFAERVTLTHNDAGRLGYKEIRLGTGIQLAVVRYLEAHWDFSGGHSLANVLDGITRGLV